MVFVYSFLILLDDLQRNVWTLTAMFDLCSKDRLYPCVGIIEWDAQGYVNPELESQTKMRWMSRFRVMDSPNKVRREQTSNIASLLTQSNQRC